MPRVYEELRRLAAGKLARERPGHTLQPTALVHEAWLRLAGSNRQDWEGRTHFFAAAAEAMRRILVDHARRRQRLKHGGGCDRVEMDAAEIPVSMRDEDLLALDEALTQLTEVDRRPDRSAKPLRRGAALLVCVAATVPCSRGSGATLTEAPIGRPSRELERSLCSAWSPPFRPVDAARVPRLQTCACRRGAPRDSCGHGGPIISNRNQRCCRRFTRARITSPSAPTSR